MHDEIWQGINWTISVKSLCFISTIPVTFIHSTIKVSKYYFFYYFFYIILYSFKGISTCQLFPGVIPWQQIKTENSVIRGSNLKGRKLPLWINVNISGTFKTYRFLWKKERRKLLQKHELCKKGYFILRRKKKFILWIF